MTLTRLFAAYIRARRRCFCGQDSLHRGCVERAFTAFLDDLERNYVP